MVLRTFLVAALLALPLWAATTMPAYACSCGSLALSAQEFDLIVVGTVSDVRVAGELSPTPEPGVPGPTAMLAWDFAVEEYIKGGGGTQLELHSNGHVSVAEDGSVTIQDDLGPDCSFGPVDGGRYLFGVRTSDGENFAGGCGSVLITSDSQSYVDDLIAEIRAALQEPAPTPTVGSFPPTGASRVGGGGAPAAFLVATSAIAAAGLLGLVAAAAFRR